MCLVLYQDIFICFPMTFLNCSRHYHTLQKLEKSLEAGNYYEAQQRIKTLHARYLAAKNYAASLDLLHSGATMQLKHDQVTCGVELGILFVETLGKAGRKYDAAALEQIKVLGSSFPRMHVSSTDRRKLIKSSESYLNAKSRAEGFNSFMRAAIRWCIETGGPTRGPKELHDMLSEYMWTQCPDLDLNKAAPHFVRSGHPERYAQAVIEYMIECDPEEVDLVLARSVLLYLTFGNLRDANFLVTEVKAALGDDKYPSSPLMQFIKYLLLTLERDALPLLHTLRENYKDHLQRDPLLVEYVDNIAERFYGEQRKTGLQRVFGDFIKMFSE
ncbi:hypothetical protein KP509_03G025900 [Ceratopteris richardii]|uniref:Golgi to ER traffic protein 4 homolog n=3 Tax=Ceratopteris richardii TaxID=49495 RepID=A0A8T2V2C0_CERRI|nr:hypothetical protein KP509_03G025900 [Ceratopteris richardii]